METKELMLGDKVQGFLPDSFSTIVGIPNAGMVAIQAKRAYIELSIDDIQPIPLTPEILERNGFEHNSLYDVWCLIKGGLKIEIGIYHPDFINIGYREETPDGINEGELCSICKVNGGDIVVHELQHALRLCGLSELADNFKV